MGRKSLRLSGRLQGAFFMVASFFRMYKFVKVSHAHCLFAHTEAVVSHDAALWQLVRRPMVAQCATAAFLFGVGDIIAQQAIEHQREEP